MRAGRGAALVVVDAVKHSDSYFEDVGFDLGFLFVVFSPIQANTE